MKNQHVLNEGHISGRISGCFGRAGRIGAGLMVGLLEFDSEESGRGGEGRLWDQEAVGESVLVESSGDLWLGPKWVCEIFGKAVGFGIPAQDWKGLRRRLTPC